MRVWDFGYLCFCNAELNHGTVRSRHSKAEPQPVGGCVGL